MPIRRYEVSPPFDHQAGDRYERAGKTVRQVRGGLTVATRAVTEVVPLAAQWHVGGSSVNEFFEEFHMPGVVQTLVDVIKSNATGVIRFKFADGTEREFPDFEALSAQAAYLDTEGETAQDMLILKTVRNSPDGANLENMVGGSVAIDFSANTPVSLTE